MGLKDLDGNIGKQACPHRADYGHQMQQRRNAILSISIQPSMFEVCITQVQ